MTSSLFLPSPPPPGAHSEGSIIALKLRRHGLQALHLSGTSCMAPGRTLTCHLLSDPGSHPIFQSTVNIQQYKSTLENARFCYYYYSNTMTNMWDFPGGLACNARDTEFRIPGSGRSPGEGNGNPFQYLAWKIPWTKKPGGLQSTGSQKSWTQLSDCASKPQRPYVDLPLPPEALSGGERKPPTHTHALKLSYRKVRAALSWLPGKPEILYFSPVCQHSHL